MVTRLARGNFETRTQRTKDANLKRDSYIGLFRAVLLWSLKTAVSYPSLREPLLRASPVTWILTPKSGEATEVTKQRRGFRSASLKSFFNLSWLCFLFFSWSLFLIWESRLATNLGKPSTARSASNCVRHKTFCETNLLRGLKSDPSVPCSLSSNCIHVLFYSLF